MRPKAVGKCIGGAVGGWGDRLARLLHSSHYGLPLVVVNRRVITRKFRALWSISRMLPIARRASHRLGIAALALAGLSARYLDPSAWHQAGIG
jgi:hypothetical protein